MDARLETIEKIKIIIEHDMEAAMRGGIRISQCDVVTQNYLLFQMLEQLEGINKSLNLIAVYTSKSNE